MVVVVWAVTLLSTDGCGGGGGGGGRAGVARRLVPFCAVAAADVLNLGITRRDEVLQGIKVFDANGDELGRSRDAGRRAVGACIAGRVMAAAPVLVVPPLIMHRYW